MKPREPADSCLTQRALIDGETAALRKDGRSDFGALMTKRRGAQASLMAFDLLRLDGDDLRLRPIEAAAGGAQNCASSSQASADALARYSENLAR